MDEERVRKLREDEDMAFFKADLATSLPESYSLEEKKDVIREMVRTKQDMAQLMHEDFIGRDPQDRQVLLDALSNSGMNTPEWWHSVLIDGIDPDVAGIVV